MRGVDHTEKNGERSFLDVVGVLDTINGGSPVRTQTQHLIGPHDWIRGVKPPVADERKKEESGFAKLERLVVLVNIADTADKGGFSRIEQLEGIDRDSVGGVSERTQSVLNRLMLIFTTLGSQLEVVIQESKDVLRILDPWQEFIPFVGSVHGQTSGLPFLFFVVGIGERSLHDDVEEVITLRGDLVLGEGCDQFHDFQGVINLLGGGVGVLDRLDKLVVNPAELLVFFVTVMGRVSFIADGTCGSTYLLSRINRSSMCNLIPRTRPIMNRQSVTIGAGGGGSSPKE